MNKSVAWYDITGSGPVRDIWILLHPWYTMWHLSYVLLGAALVPVLNWATLGWTVLAFFLAMGIGAHCLDELTGRPLRTRVPSGVLWVVASLVIAGAIAIGVIVGVRETIWVVPCLIFGGFIVFAYNLELFGGLFHHDFWFGFAWGAFPVITAYLAQTGSVSLGAVLVAVFALLYSMAQRALSTPVRFFRRKVTQLEGHYFTEGEHEVTPGTGAWPGAYKLTKQDIIQAPELALKLMTWAVVTIAVGLLLTHL